MNDTSDKPRQTISITRKPSMPATTTTGAGSEIVKRGGKRIITRDQLPASSLTRPGKFEKPKPKQKPANTRRKPRQPPKPKKTPPSELRARELNDSLNAFEVWRTHKPLALGIERQVFQCIGELHLSASKRVVQKLLHHHTHNRAYLLHVGSGGMRFNLDGSEEDQITQGERDHSARVLAAMTK